MASSLRGALGLIGDAHAARIERDDALVVRQQRIDVARGSRGGWRWSELMRNQDLGDAHQCSPAGQLR